MFWFLGCWDAFIQAEHGDNPAERLAVTQPHRAAQGVIHSHKR